jgi:predicted metal-dependent phosphoesterase TrpH
MTFSPRDIRQLGPRNMEPMEVDAAPDPRTLWDIWGKEWMRQATLKYLEHKTAGNFKLARLWLRADHTTLIRDLGGLND